MGVDLAIRLGNVRVHAVGHDATRSSPGRKKELFAAVAEVALGDFIAQVENITADMAITEQLVEVVAYIIETLPRSPQLVLLLANDRSNSFSRMMLAPNEIARCRTILQHTHRPGIPGL